LCEIVRGYQRVLPQIVYFNANVLKLLLFVFATKKLLLFEIAQYDSTEALRKGNDLVFPNNKTFS
jgi:hypothetical protein